MPINWRIIPQAKSVRTHGDERRVGHGSEQQHERHEPDDEYDEAPEKAAQPIARVRTRKWPRIDQEQRDSCTDDDKSADVAMAREGAPPVGNPLQRRIPHFVPQLNGHRALVGHDPFMCTSTSKEYGNHGGHDPDSAQREHDPGCRYEWRRGNGGEAKREPLL